MKLEKREREEMNAVLRSIRFGSSVYTSLAPLSTS